jgi:hypothetical protein
VSRDVPFDPDAPCEACGKFGAFDFMGDLLCDTCAGPEPTQALKDLMKGTKWPRDLDDALARFHAAEGEP